MVYIWWLQWVVGSQVVSVTHNILDYAQLAFKEHGEEGGLLKIHTQEQSESSERRGCSIELGVF